MALDHEDIELFLLRAAAALELAKGRSDLPLDLAEAFDALHRARGAWPETELSAMWGAPQPMGTSRELCFAVGVPTDQSVLVRSVDCCEIARVRLYGKSTPPDTRWPQKYMAEAEGALECWTLLRPRERLLVSVQGGRKTSGAWKLRGYVLR